MGLASYGIYGLRLECSRPLGLAAEPPRAGLPAVAVNFEETTGPAPALPPIPPLYESSGRNARDVPWLRVWRPAFGSLVFRHDGQRGWAQFDVGRECIDIRYARVPPLDVEAYLLGPVLGGVLRLRGVATLHACVVASPWGAVALTGPKGAGKSTLAGALATRGWAILADDVAAVSATDGCVRTQPGYPWLRMWRDTLEALACEPADGGFCPVLAETEKFFVPLRTDSGGGWRFEGEAQPLRAVYQIADGERTEVEAVALVEALRILTGAVYAPYLREPGRDFPLLAEVARRTAVRRLHRSRGLAHLPRVLDAIADDVASLARAASQA